MEKEIKYRQRMDRVEEVIAEVRTKIAFLSKIIHISSPITNLI